MILIEPNATTNEINPCEQYFYNDDETLIFIYREYPHSYLEASSLSKMNIHDDSKRFKLMVNVVP